MERRRKIQKLIGL